jgi:formamidopyrimidine-DNA glycosylase
LVTETKQILCDAIEAGGSTLRDHVTATGEMGYFQHNFKVYGREGEACPACMKPVKRIVQAGRSTFYCASCQR